MPNAAFCFSRRAALMTGLLVPVMFSVTLALAREIVPHFEECTVWDERDGHFGTVNSCDKPVVIQFMRLDDQRVVRRTLKPGERLDVGEKPQDAQNGGWIFTTCPVGYSPTVAFAPENKDAIFQSQYECMTK